MHMKEDPEEFERFVDERVRQAGGRVRVKSTWIVCTKLMSL